MRRCARVTAGFINDHGVMLSEARQEAELLRLVEETKKFVAEADKLEAERRKLDRERVWFPWLQLLTLVVSSATIGAIVARLLH